MARDAPEGPAAATEQEQAPKPTPVVEDISSLTEVVEAAKDAPPKPDPIIVLYDLPPSEKHPLGRTMRLTIETRYPADAWLFGIKYQTEVQRRLRETKVEEGSNQVVPAHPLADMEALAREVVVKPTWLHSEAGLLKLRDSIPSPIFRDLRARLMLTAGLNGDFFDVYQRLTMPSTYLLSAFESQSASASTPTPSGTSAPNNSSPGPSTTGGAAPKTAESASPTTSGSLPSTPTTEPPV